MNPHSSRVSGRYRFPKEARLLRPGEYRRVYDRGTRRNLDFMLAFTLLSEQPSSRIGVTVPRAVGGSVQRNLLKRRLREAIRRHMAELGPGWDIVFNVRQSACNVAFSAIDLTVKQFFQACAARMRGPLPVNVRGHAQEGRAAQ